MRPSDLFENVAQRLLDLIRRAAGTFKARRGERYQCVNFDGVAGLYARHGRRCGVVVTQATVFGVGFSTCVLPACSPCRPRALMIIKARTHAATSAVRLSPYALFRIRVHQFTCGMLTRRRRV
jgi:hypothetical protein